MTQVHDSKIRIARKALELFVQFGIRSVSMDDIASAAGMSKKTIYQHFSNKNELVMGVVQAVLQQNCDASRAGEQEAENAIHEWFLAIDKTTEFFRRMNPLLIFDLKKYHPLAYRAYTDFKSEFLYTVIKSSLERGIKEGLYRADMNVEITARFRVESVLIPFIPEFYTKIKAGLDEANKELYYLFLYGIASPKGLKLIEKYKKNKHKAHANN